jgi:hypothetical protein
VHSLTLLIYLQNRRYAIWRADLPRQGRMAGGGRNLRPYSAVDQSDPGLLVLAVSGSRA